jgi:hypothetical protein
MTRSLYALVLLASSTALAHVHPRQAAYSNITTVDVRTGTEPRGSRPALEAPVTSLDSPTSNAHAGRTTISLDFPSNIQSESAHTERTGTRLDPPKTARTEETQTSLNRPPVPTDGIPTTQWTVHTEKSQTTIERPGTISWITWDTSTQITLPIPRTEIGQTTLDRPGTTLITASKAVTQEPGPTLDVPEGSPATASQLGTAIQIEKPGQNTNDARPGGAVGKPDNDDGQSSPGGSQGQPENNKPAGNQSPQGSQSQNPTPTAGGFGGLISAIQSVATKQAGAVQNSQDGRKDSPISPDGVITTAAPGSRPSVTGFVIGSQTVSPDGAAITEGGSVYSALPNGSGLQVIANGNTITMPGTPFAGTPSVQAGESDTEYVFEGHTLTVGGQAISSGDTTFSALPLGGGVRVVSNGHTSTMPVPRSAIATGIQTGKTDNEYILSGKTLTAGGDALTSAGTTYSALPSGSGLIIAVGGPTSMASVGEVVHENIAGSNSGLPTPILLPADSEQLITIGDHTYTAHITDSSLLVLGSQTITPGVIAVINGETLLLNGTNLVLATGTSTSTRGLGSPIMSGIGGESGSQKGSTDNESSDSSAPTAESTSGAEQRSLSDMRVLFGHLTSVMFVMILL